MQGNYKHEQRCNRCQQRLTYETLACSFAGFPDNIAVVTPCLSALSVQDELVYWDTIRKGSAVEVLSYITTGWG